MRILSNLRRHLSTTTFPPKICIVGAGPAGYYAAQYISKRLNQSEIDFYEKLPVPFGLVRFGVAPDHPEVKNVINTFTKTAQQPNVRFFGNICLGKDITLKDLRNAYHVVILSYGAEQNRKLQIPGEDLCNSLAARDIVGWYNGIPWNNDLEVDLSGDVAAIFGQGNVAIDIARILLSPLDKLKATDITDHAYNVLATSKIKEVHLIGRRGPLQAAFTTKELREMLKFETFKTCWCLDDFKGIQDIVPQLVRPRKRLTELMLESLQESGKGEKTFKPVFFRSPLELTGKDSVEKVKLGVNKLEGDDFLTPRAVLTDATEYLDCQLAITSIGYKSVRVDIDIPFDESKGVAKHVKGKIDEGLYATGWLATGPTGVILNTMSNSFCIADNVIRDLQTSKILNVNKGGWNNISEILTQRNKQIVTWNDWLKIDKHEVEEGKKVGKPRKKVVSIEKMLEIAAS